MKSKAEIDEKWIKASIIGTIWAASEIVLGSFLHNLKIPFSGNILTAIGIIILISVSYIWEEKGLFWRAGLICAIMKTMSPSAVIFGPMIAIFSEAMLLEISVRLLGKSIGGYIVGAALAMSWNLFQKLANLIIFYGFNIVELYKNILKYAQIQLHFQIDVFWSPIIVLGIIYCILGILSAIIGIKVGRKIVNQPVEYNSLKLPADFPHKQKEQPEFGYSLVWLLTNILLIVSELLMMNYGSLPVWSLSVIVIVIVWGFRYKRALLQLSKPKFWIYFVLITMLSAFAFSKFQSQSIENGLLIGLQMNFRAVIIILGFSVMGTELYNPKIRSFFLKTSFKQLPLALELSFESLPSMVANVPDFKTIIRNPVGIIYQFISQVDFRLAELKKRIVFQQKVFIITGKVGEGKTTFLLSVIENLRKNRIETGGIYSPKVTENNEILGYDIIDISTYERTAFLRKDYNEISMKIGKFFISTLGLQKGNSALKNSIITSLPIVCIDEVGNLELNEGGWAGSIEELLVSGDSHILMVVREGLVEKVISKWNFKQYHIFSIAENSASRVSSLIAGYVFQ